MTIAALEPWGTDLIINYNVGPDNVRATGRLYSSGVRTGLMIISHGGQRENQFTTHGAQVRTFVFLVPFRNRLLRKTPAYGPGWIDRVAALVGAHSSAFLTVGIPSIYLQPHAFDNMDTDYESDGAAYLAALQHWDVFLFTDLNPWSTPNPELPLYRLLNGTPSLANKYNTFIMHCCRSEQMKAGGACTHTGAITANGVYSYNDQASFAF